MKQKQMNFFDKEPLKGLRIPDGSLRDDQSIELLRVWVANGGQHITIRVQEWQDPAAWGLMLSDLMKHVARASAQSNNKNFSVVLKQLQVELLTNIRPMIQTIKSEKRAEPEKD